jgi:hypothetical protein
MICAVTRRAVAVAVKTVIRRQETLDRSKKVII